MTYHFNVLFFLNITQAVCKKKSNTQFFSVKAKIEKCEVPGESQGKQNLELVSYANTASFLSVPSGWLKPEEQPSKKKLLFPVLMSSLRILRSRSR